MIKINYMKIILKEGLVGPVSRSIRRLASPKRKLKTKVLFLVEGKTEKNIIFHLFDQNDYSNISFSVKEYQGGGYADIRHWVAKRRDSLDIVFVICDLDRAQEDTERKSLITTIKFLENANNRNNIFLSCPDFEQWMLCGLPGSNNKPFTAVSDMLIKKSKRRMNICFPSIQVREATFPQPKDTFPEDLYSI